MRSKGSCPAPASLEVEEIAKDSASPTPLALGISWPFQGSCGLCGLGPEPD